MGNDVANSFQIVLNHNRSQSISKGISSPKLSLFLPGMEELNLPPYPFKVKSENGKQFIFDEIRKKYLVLTPEEWVRQHFIMYLNSEKEFPLSLMSIERGLLVNNMPRRSDIVIFGKDGKPRMVVECKAPKIKITQNVFDQAARYNMQLKVPFLTVTNGLSHYCCLIDHKRKSYDFLEEIPPFTNIR